MDWKEFLKSLGVPVPEGIPVERWAASLTDSPAKNTAMAVGVSSVLFYLAERNHNPKVADIWDAMVYCSTCLSVGYGDIFAKTPIGKILGTALMTMGPALSGAALDGEAGERDETQREILRTLREILQRLPENSSATS